MDMNNLVRWRMVLGRFSNQKLREKLSPTEDRMEKTLDYLYGREYEDRGVWGDVKRHGSLDPTQLTVPNWLKETRKLFPKETVRIIEKHALDKYKLTELLLDSQTLKTLEPDMDLLKMLLTFKGLMNKEILDEARVIIKKVVRDITDELSRYIKRIFSGRLNRFKKSQLKISQNFDWKNTIKANLKYFDKQENKIIPKNLQFFSRIKKEIPWEIILCVDQSGSMTESIIYSSVMAGIFAALPSIRVKLIIFDTSIVDLSEFVNDPVEILMSVQLGGGTDIGGAAGYCRKLVSNPLKTIFILITDFCEGASPKALYNNIKKLKDDGVKLLGLASLDAEAAPSYDKEIAGNLSAIGMDIASLTPKGLASWLKNVIS